MKITREPNDTTGFTVTGPLVVLYAPGLEDGCSGDESHWPEVVGVVLSPERGLSMVEEHYAALLVELDIEEDEEEDEGAWTWGFDSIAIYVCERDIMRYCIQSAGRVDLAPAENAG